MFFKVQKTKTDHNQKYHTNVFQVDIHSSSTSWRRDHSFEPDIQWMSAQNWICSWIRLQIYWITE